MKEWVGRGIAYVLIGSFCLVGPLLLCIGLGSALQRTALLYSGLRADGTVIAKRATGSSRVTYAPVFQFTAADGRSYIVNSDVSGRESAFDYGEHVRVLYRPDHPESARIDALASLWTFPFVFGVVGGAFSVIPALALTRWKRRRSGEGAPESESESPSDAANKPHRGLGLLLIGGGVALLAAGLGFAPFDSTSVNESRVVLICVGVLLAATGVLAGRWVATGSRLCEALGAVAITAMAVLFGWIAIYGQAAGFSGGVSMGGLAVTSGASVTPARIAFGIGSLVFGLASLPAWKQAFGQRAPG